jgi:hypothetical protein
MQETEARLMQVVSIRAPLKEVSCRMGEERSDRREKEKEKEKERGRMEGECRVWWWQDAQRSRA